MSWLQRFMAGRYGNDNLNLVLFALYFILYVISGFVHSNLLAILALACVALSFYRTFSRNIAKRRAENAKFMELIRPVMRWVRVKKARRQDREHCYFRCPNCGQQLRVPKGKGKISITCRSCGVSFEKKT